MKLLRFAGSLALASLSTVAFAQSGAPPASAPPEAQKSFALLKTLTGTWQGSFQTSIAIPGRPTEGRIEVTLRVTSRGNAIVHEMYMPGAPEDPALSDHPVTVLYLDGEQLMLTHYCDVGNRPSMSGKISPDGKAVEFHLAAISGPLKHGYMRDAVFTLVDANRHTEEWTLQLPDGKAVTGHLELHRKEAESPTSGE